MPDYIEAVDVNFGLLLRGLHQNRLDVDLCGVPGWVDEVVGCYGL